MPKMMSRQPLILQVLLPAHRFGKQALKPLLLKLVVEDRSEHLVVADQEQHAEQHAGPIARVRPRITQQMAIIERLKS